MSYLERLRAIEHEKTGTLSTDKADKRASVGFVGAPGVPFSRGADLSETHSNQHSSQRQCSVCGQQARFGYGVHLRHGEEGRWFCAAHRPTEFGSA